MYIYIYTNIYQLSRHVSLSISNCGILWLNSNGLWSGNAFIQIQLIHISCGFQTPTCPVTCFNTLRPVRNGCNFPSNAYAGWLISWILSVMIWNKSSRGPLKPEADGWHLAIGNLSNTCQYVADTQEHSVLITWFSSPMQYAINSLWYITNLQPTRTAIASHWRGKMAI